MRPCIEHSVKHTRYGIHKLVLSELVPSGVEVAERAQHAMR